MDLNKVKPAKYGYKINWTLDPIDPENNGQEWQNETIKDIYEKKGVFNEGLVIEFMSGGKVFIEGDKVAQKVNVSNMGATEARLFMEWL